MKIITGICVTALLSTAAALLAQAPPKAVASDTPAARPANRSAASQLPFPRSSAETLVPRRPETSAPAVRPPSGSYRLNKGDTVQLSVFNEPKLDDESILSNSGEVSFPLIGSVELAGKTVKEAEK